MNRQLVKLACILGLLGIPACSTGKALPPGPGGNNPKRELADRVKSKDELAILFVGNSYSFGVPKAFSKLAASRGKQVRVGHSTFGGWSLVRHAASDATLKKIRSAPWDIIVIQEQSEIPALPPRKLASAMFPPLRFFVVEARKQGAIPVLYQTWGRRDGDKKRRNDNFKSMNARLRSGYQSASRNAGGLVIVPVGDAWEKEVSAGNASALFMEDGSHPTTVGNNLTAETFYRVIFAD